MPTASIEVLWTARYDYQPHWRLAKHSHDHFQMIYFISGSACVSIEGRDYRVGAGSLVLVKPRCVHALNPISLVKTLDIKFQVNDRGLRKLICDAAEFVVNCEASIADLFERIRHEGERRGPYYRELCSALLMEMMLLHLRAARTHEEKGSVEFMHPQTLGDRIVQQAAEFIREHHAADFSMIDVARVVGRSDRHVRQHFKETLGVSPRRYLLRYRIQKAQHLIEFSSYAFKEIAAMVGFKTVHHFTRAFHEVCGETPGEWRRKYQAGICKDVNIDPDFVNVNRTVRIDSQINSPAGI